ncbi:6-cysteine protein [Plasmodium malariae]|uniref:6-cysteine protein n=3 Tax=Plasmodium (Plasmodium) TaxID=418103 RepID=A0A1D3JIG7_PLAMA|nr:6-cysteine protein [Plasmodium malariae]SBT86192.1 6-cysteine protein [Plasmodium malariae]
MHKINACFPVIKNLFLFILLYYFFSFFVLFSFFCFKMRKIFYSLLVLMYIYLYLYSPVYMLYLKELEVGNYYICNLKDFPKEFCTVDYDDKKIIKFLCPNYNTRNKQTYNSSYCFKYLGIKDRLIIDNKQEQIYDTLPGIILENYNIFERYNLGIYAPPIIKEDVTIVCICDSSKENKGITPYLKINIKKSNSSNNNNSNSNENFIKGCDFGNNRGKHQFLSKPISKDESFLCEMDVYPEDIIGINCNNYTIKESKYGQLDPLNCFATVSFSMYTLNYIRMSINNLLPEAKYYPELSSFPRDKNFLKFSTTSYLWVPKNISRDFLFTCSCVYSNWKGVAMFYVRTAKDM